MLPGLSDPFWVGLLAKMLATAAIVVAVSALVERVGPFLGAMIATLPISAGPALVFMAMDHGPAFWKPARAQACPRSPAPRSCGCVRSTGPALPHPDQRGWGFGSVAAGLALNLVGPGLRLLG